MKNRIPIQRQAVYLAVFSLLPLIMVAIHWFNQHHYIQGLENRSYWLKSSAADQTQQEKANKAIRQIYAKTDRFYVDKHLESLPLRQEEVHLLQQSLQNRVLPAQEPLERRLEFLSKQNRLRFAEAGRQAYKDFQEVTESLQAPVEVDLLDLQHLLTIIEEPPVEGQSKPHLIITDLSLDRKKVFSDNEAFQLNLKFLKREYP